MDLILLALWGKQVAQAVGALSACVLLYYGCYGFFTYVNHDDHYGKTPYVYPYKWQPWVAFIVFAVSMLYPSERLIFAYAVTKGGEKVLELPEFEKARKLLNIKLDEIIGDKAK